MLSASSEQQANVSGTRFSWINGSLLIKAIQSQYLSPSHSIASHCPKNSMTKPIPKVIGDFCGCQESTETSTTSAETWVLFIQRVGVPRAGSFAPTDVNQQEKTRSAISYQKGWRGAAACADRCSLEAAADEKKQRTKESKIAKHPKPPRQV